MIRFEIEWINKKIVVGKGENVLVNQLVGINDSREYLDCLDKINMWDKESNGPDIITDVSTYWDESHCVWEYALKKANYIVASVPIYFVKKKDFIDKNELLSIIRLQLSRGVKIITIHPTPTRELIELSQRRIVPFTSRGGGIVIRDLINNKRKNNIYLELLEEIIQICDEYDAVISIGTCFRAANIFDSMDYVQKKEISIQYELAKHISSKGVKVIVEMPGHASPQKIEELNGIIANEKFPIMPLGPIVTDIGDGLDHITAAIGLVLMGLRGNVQIISAVTAEEHTGEMPSKKSTYEAIKTAKLVAHIIDMEQKNDYTEDYHNAVARKECCNVHTQKNGCSRCGVYCPLTIDKSR